MFTVRILHVNGSVVWENLGHLWTPYSLVALPWYPPSGKTQVQILNVTSHNPFKHKLSFRHSLNNNPIMLNGFAYNTDNSYFIAHLGRAQTRCDYVVESEGRTIQLIKQGSMLSAQNVQLSSLFFMIVFMELFIIFLFYFNFFQKTWKLCPLFFFSSSQG